MSYRRRNAGDAILKALHSVGGVASREKLRSLIADDEQSGFSYEDVYGQVTSKSGNQYAPFAFDFNFALKELAFLGYIAPLQRGGDITQTESGRQRLSDSKKYPTGDEKQKIAAYWASKKRPKQVQAIDQNTGHTFSNPADETEEDASVLFWRSRLLQQLKHFSAIKFESFARLLISKMGVKIDKKRGVVASGDHGIDGFGYFESDEFRTTRVAIQAKCYTDIAVSEPEIDKFKGVMDGFNAEYGIFITTTYFTPRAKAKAIQGTRTVTLIDGQRIADLVATYQLYAKPVKTYVLDDYYFEQD